MKKIYLYDTTLRDGAQAEGVSYSLQDKINIANKLDDFGVENSNFSRLLEIDLDLIKIDGLFIKNIHISEKDKKVVQAIVGLARTLGVETVAEFVENEEVLKTLIECGVDYAQGYYIGKPEKYLLEELELTTV